MPSPKERYPAALEHAEFFASNLDEPKFEGKYRVLTPEQALQSIEEGGSLHLVPLAGGYLSLTAGLVYG